MESAPSLGPGVGIGVLGSFTGRAGTPALTPTTSGGLLARLSDSSPEQLQVPRG